MSFTSYLKDKIYTMILHIVCIILLSAFLESMGNSVSEILLIIIAWILIVSVYFFADFYGRKKYLKKLLDTAEKLEQKYLISVVMDKPHRLDDLIYYRILKLANKSMLEKITSIKNERKEYKEYIEQWVHEIKTPIAAMKLICENNKNEKTRKLLSQLEKTDRFVEQALFYARSENIEKDYLIKEVLVTDIVHQAVLRNKLLLIQNNVSIKIENCDYTVFTDSKWVEFILNQIIINAVKYKKVENEEIKINSRIIKNGVAVYIEDNGIGIVGSDLSRIFDKGFTGKNGRTYGQSTGIGLYLCKKLCDKLGLEISAESKENKFTRLTIFFPKGTFVKMQD